VDWTQPALAVRRLINGVTPEPGAWTQLGNQRVKVGPVSLVDSATGLSPGTLSLEVQGVLVGTGSGAIVLGDVQPAGKKLMRAQDWARGALQPLQQGELVFS